MDASAELLNAVLDTLREDNSVAALVDARIYDRVPEDANGSPAVQSPYISLGPTVAVPDDFDCADGEEITFQVDAWSWGPGAAYSSAEVRKLAGAIKRALHNAEFSLSKYALVSLTHTLTRVLRDPDGITNHAAVQFTAIVEHP